MYGCDNDGVDHQVVAMEYPGGATATFTMTAFTEAVGNRSTRFFGTHGELAGDGQSIRVYDFLTRTEESIAVTGDGSMNAADGHGGGDEGLMDAFIEAVATKDPTRIKSGPRDSLLGHLSVLAAERARRNEPGAGAPPRSSRAHLGPYQAFAGMRPRVSPGHEITQVHGPLTSARKITQKWFRMISRNLAKVAGRLVALHGHDRGKPKLWHHPGWVTEEHTRAYIAASEHGDPGSRRLQRGERDSILK